MAVRMPLVIRASRRGRSTGREWWRPGGRRDARPEPFHIGHTDGQAQETARLRAPRAGTVPCVQKPFWAFDKQAPKSFFGLIPQNCISSCLRSPIRQRSFRSSSFCGVVDDGSRTLFQSLDDERR